MIRKVAESQRGTINSLRARHFGLTLGVVGAVLVPVWAVIGAIAALVAEVTIVVEKSE